MHLGMANLAKSKVACAHAKRVYSGESLGSFNDVPHYTGTVVSWYWICPECLEVGSDFFDASYRPCTDPKEYWKRMREREPRCFVPRAYR